MIKSYNTQGRRHRKANFIYIYIIVRSRFSDWAPSNGWNPGPTDPLQWICREWVQGPGFDETTVNAGVGDDRLRAKNTEVDGLTIRGNKLLVRRYEFSSGLIRQEHEGGICAPFPPRESEPPLLGEISYLIYFPSVHPSPTLVSHPCPHLSARPISHSFWRSVSCCDLDSTVKASRPHKWGQDISCGYLMRRWQPFLGLLLHHAPMASPLCLGFPLGRSRRLPLVACRFPFSWSQFAEDRIVLDNISWQSGLSMLILRHFFLLGMGHGLDMK